jgi:uncharacterized protein (TIGR02284 family)
MNTKLTNDDVISVLNDLIEICKDGEEGFRTAGDAVEDPDLRTLFHMYAQQRARFGAELNNEVLRHGGDPATSGHVSAALHRGWLNIKTAVTGKNVAAIIDECERGEDVAVNTYQDALKKVLPADLLAVVQEQYAEIKRAHGAVSALKHEVHTHAAN